MVCLFLSGLISSAEKFDDIKFGKVLTKLYARLFSMEQSKLLPPKFSHSLKDLTSFLGIFEITEEDISGHRDTSETSSNLSHVTQGMMKRGKELEVVHEKQNGSDSEDTDRQSDHNQMKTNKMASRNSNLSDPSSAKDIAQFSSHKAKMMHARLYSMSEEKSPSPVMNPSIKPPLHEKTPLSPINNTAAFTNIVNENRQGQNPV